MWQPLNPEVFYVKVDCIRCENIRYPRQPLTGSQRIYTIQADADMFITYELDHGGEFRSLEPVVIFNSQREVVFSQQRNGITDDPNNGSRFWLVVITINYKSQ